MPNVYVKELNKEPTCHASNNKKDFTNTYSVLPAAASFSADGATPLLP